MNIKIVCLLLISLHMILAQDNNVEPCDSTAVKLLNDQELPSFDEFKKLYNKEYESAEDEQNRCRYYYQNVALMLEQAKIATWELGVNDLFDISQEEWHKRTKLNQKQPTESEVEEHKKIQIRVGQSGQKDWRDEKKVTSVKNQGSCGSCWSFATCAYGESKLIIEGKQQIQIDLSEQYLIDCSDQNSCNGGYLETSFQLAAKDGIPLESAHPYEEKDNFFPSFCFSFFNTRVGYIPRAFYKLTDAQLITLLQKGPLAISIASKDWTSYKRGIFKCNRSSKIDHAVLLVGYTNDYWIVKNQWGSAWGQQGYIRITRNSFQNCKIGTSAFMMYQAISVSTMIMIMASLIVIFLF